MDARVAKRLTLVVLLVLSLAAGIVARLAYLQVYRREALRLRASHQHQRKIEVPATRGAILDRQGRELALSLATQALSAHPRRVREPELAARRLAPILGLPGRQILERLRSDKPFVYLARSLEPEQVQAIRDLGSLPLGDTQPFGLLPSSRRYYPGGKLAVHMLGFANVDGVGVEGIEMQYDDELRGDPTVYLVLQDGQSGHLARQPISPAAEPPRDVVLSIDLVLQHAVERELDRAMRETGSRSASAVLLDPASGQVLALANRPAADPNRYGEASAAERTNRALVHQYEPGSTFKIVSMAAALDQGRVRPDQRVDCEHGSYVHRGRLIQDISDRGIVSAREVLEFSSNVGMVKILQGVEPQGLHDAIERFGFGRRTGLELPGELPGSLRPVAQWSAQTQPSLAFGYEISVTVVQMASALATIANDGVRVPPHVVLGLRDGRGRLERFDPPQPSRAIGSDTARELMAMMEGVVLRGTGTRARIPGYRLAAKSGTARKLVGGRYSDTEFVASFGGFGPVSAPRIAGLVVLDDPHGAHHGGEVAAPVFRRVMEAALAHLRVPADEGGLTLAGLRSVER